jgi:hypothetical protein
VIAGAGRPDNPTTTMKKSDAVCYAIWKWFQQSIYSAVGVEIVSIIKFRGVAPLILLYAAAICSLRLTSSSSLIVVVYIVLWHHPTSKSKIYMYYILCVCGWIMNWRRLHTWSERWKQKQILIFFCFCFTLFLNCNIVKSSECNKK